MKHSIYIFLLCLYGVALHGQIELPLESNYILQRLYENETANYPKGWDAVESRQRDCMLEEEDIIYVIAGQTVEVSIEIDTADLGTSGDYVCKNCDGNPIGEALTEGDLFVITADPGLITASYTFTIEYCTDNGCNDVSYEVFGKRAGRSYYPNAIYIDAEESIQVNSEASLLPGSLACNKIIDAADNYEGRSQLSYFTNYSSVDSTIVYVADRYAGVDSIFVVLCDSFTICDTFHYAFNIAHDTIIFGAGGVDYFMDDFSYTGPFPDGDLWLDKDVFVNRTYAENPPSLGVATFDGLQSTGTPWPGSYGDADRLTSTYLDISSVSGSLSLSYWLRNKGLGLTPEEEDIITLEFKDQSGEWQLIQTYTPGDTSMTGQSVDDGFVFFSHEITSAFRHDAFQFRFTAFNDRRGIGDIWLLDYVRINSEAELPIERDIAITRPPIGILDLYRSLPWKHFRNRVEDFSRSTLDVGLYNFNESTINVGDAELRLVEEVTGTIVYENIEILSNQSPNLVPGATNLEPPIESYNTQLNVLQSGVFDNEEELRFRMSYELIDPPTQNASPNDGRISILRNDTASIITKFSNYFAYDDGIAESAVAAQEDDLIAVQFEATIADSLRAVQIHFPHMQTDISNQQFNLHVWIGQLDDEPEYSLNLINPIYPDNSLDTLQGFTTYVLTDANNEAAPLALPVGVFYVGWQQQSDCDFTNCIAVGMDRNNSAALSTLYFNNNGTNWVPFPSDFTPGALMIRPVVGSETPDPTSGLTTVEANDQLLRLYPNPSTGKVQLVIPQEDITIFECHVYNQMGQLVYQSHLSDNTLELQHLSNGVYIVRVIDPKDGISYQERLILTK